MRYSSLTGLSGMKIRLIQSLALVMFSVFIGTSPAASQVPSCPATQMTLQNMIDVDIKPGVFGGILATTAHSIMTVQNDCYMNVKSYNANALIALANPINTLNGLCTYGNCGGGGGGSGNSNTLTFTTTAAAKAAMTGAPPLFLGVSFVVVEAVVTPSSTYATCGMTYAWQSGSSSVYNAFSGPGGQFGATGTWVPQYSLNPVETCQFAAYGDASYPTSGFSLTGSTSGNTLATSSASSFGVGYKVASVNWHSQGSAAIIPSTVTSIGSGSVTLDNAQSTASGLNLVAWNPINATTVGGTDMTVPINAAIKYAIANKVTNVHLADGNYAINSGTIFLGTNDSSHTRTTVNLYGDHSGEFQPGSEAAGAFLICTFTDRACVAFSNALYSSLKGVGLGGPNYDYPAWGHVYNYTMSSDLYDWLDPTNNPTIGVAAGGLQPQSFTVGVAIDPCADSAPTAPYGTAYGGCVYGQGYSTGVTVEDTSVVGFPIARASGINTQNQGDFTKFEHSYTSMGVVGDVVKNSQARLTEDHKHTGQGLFALFSNDLVGEHTTNGTLIGTLGDWHCAECYQVFHIDSQSAGPIRIDGVYEEASAIIGTASGGSVATSIILDNVDANFYETGSAGTKTIPNAYFNIMTYATIYLENASINGSQRMTNLAWGGGNLVLKYNNTINCSQAGPGGDPAKALAVNSSIGGCSAGDTVMNVAGNNNLVVQDTVKGLYFPTASSVGFGYYNSDISFLQNATVLGRSPVTQASNGWVDSSGYHWHFTPQLTGRINGAGQIVSPSLTGDLLSFTLPSSLNNTKTAYKPGHILTYGGSGSSPANGTIFIVESVTCTTDCAITAKQQNNINTDASGNYVSQVFPSLLSDLTSSGYLFNWMTNIFAPYEVMYGTVSGTGVSAIGRGDSPATCANMANGYVSGDYYTSPPFNQASSTHPWLFNAGSYNTLNTVTVGSCTMAFQFPNTGGTGPILPLRAY